MQDDGLASESMMFAGVMMLGRNGDEEAEEEETGRIDDEGEDMKDEQNGRDGGIFSWFIIDEEEDNEARVRREDGIGVKKVSDDEIAAKMETAGRGDNGALSLANGLHMRFLLYIAYFLLF